jgi:demethylmenaquinone methyltransferase/2-methoxy-6-polyprenyl-1,4-benzoquinol methylase
MFSEQVSPTYELVNHMLTLGLDRVWRKRAARLAAKEGGRQWVDLCTGTGEMAAYLARRAPEKTKVFAVDFSEPMMAEAKKKPEANRITFVTGDIKSLPFADADFDLATISFATRNINLDKPTLIQTFAEIRRILKPGGRFVNLETSMPKSKLIRKARDLYVRLMVKPVGTRISGSRKGYAYLASTIQRFYSAKELAGVLQEAGFSDVTFRQYLFGVAAIHVGRKG